MRAIVAVDEDNAIGWSDGRLPWRIPEDLKRFKRLTTEGQDPLVVMGRKTFDSIGKALPGRTNYVMTRGQEAFGRITAAGAFPLYTGFHELPETAWLIGGASLYDAALDQGVITELHVTLVHARSGADVRLKHDLYNWKMFAVRELHKGRPWALASVQPAEASAEATFITLIRT